MVLSVVLCAPQGLGLSPPLHRGPSLPARAVNGTASPPSAVKASSAASAPAAAKACNGGVTPQQDGHVGQQQGSAVQSAPQAVPRQTGLSVKFNGKTGPKADQKQGTQGDPTSNAAVPCLTAPLQSSILYEESTA